MGRLAWVGPLSFLLRRYGVRNALSTPPQSADRGRPRLPPKHCSSVQRSQLEIQFPDIAPLRTAQALEWIGDLTATKLPDERRNPRA